MKLITLSEVLVRLCISRTTFYRIREDKYSNFPKAIHVWPNTIRFDADELSAWVKSRQEGWEDGK